MAKSKTKTYTTSELAKEFNISVVSASRFIVKHNFKPIKTGEHNAKYYSDNVFQQMKKYYQSKAKTGVKHKQTTVIEQLEARIKDQANTIDLLKQQLIVKDEQIAAANRIADQAQKLDLTTHKQTNTVSKELTSKPIESQSDTHKHGWLWKLTH